MEKSLALTRPACEISAPAIMPYLGDVTTDRLPAPNLTDILLGHPPSKIVPTVPLKPASRIVGMYPALPSPDGQRLRSLHLEKIQTGVLVFHGKLGASEPRFRKLFPAIGQILATEHAKGEHFPRCQIGPKVRVEIPAHRLGTEVSVTLLHLVTDDDNFRSHSVAITFFPAKSENGSEATRATDPVRKHSR